MREKRWVILAEDGRHVSVGRHTDPTQEAIARSAGQLRAMGIGGWLAVLDGSYYEPSAEISLLAVREIAAPTPGTGWDQAEALFRSLRARANEAA